MKKKYLYNGQIMQHSDIEDAAKQSNLDVDAYIQKAGIKPIEDNYSLGGKNFSAEDILDAANQSKLGFDDYIQKAGFEKKNQSGNNLSVGADGQLKQSNPTTSVSQIGYDITKSVPEYHNQPSSTEGSFLSSLPSHSDVAKGQKSTDNLVPDNSNKRDLAAEDYAVRVRKATPDALTNTAKNSLRQKGINPEINTAQLNQEKAKYALELGSGNADVGFDKEGKPGLIQKTGFLDSFHEHMMSAINENKNAREFKDMTVPQRVEFAKKLQEKEPTPYIGSKPTALGSLGATGGDITPTLGLYAAGGLAGGLLESAAPETGGLSHLALKPVMSFVTNAGSEANKSGMQGTLSRFYAIKQQHPDISDEDAMKHASNGEDVDRLAGIAQAALFSETGGTLGKSVTKSFLKSAAKTGLDVGGKTAVVEGLKDIGHNAEGVTDKSASDIVKDMGKAFAENAPIGAALHGFMGLITGVAKLPGLLKSALKYDVVTKMRPEEVNAEIDKNVASGAIAPEQANKAKADLDQFKTVVNKVPIGLSDESKASAAGLILKRENLKKEVENKDESTKEIYDEQIGSINNQLKEIYRTDKPLEHEINPATGETFKKPTFDNIAAMKVKNLADKISKGKEITEPEEIQVEHNFPDELEKNLKRIAREEKSGNKDKENPNTELSDNIDTYLKNNEKNKLDTKSKNEDIKPTEETGIADEGTDKEVKPTEEITQPINSNQDAVPEQTTNEMDVRQQAENGEGVGSGNAQSKEPTGESGQPPISKEENQTTGEEGNTVGIHHEALTKLADKLGLPKPEAGDVFTPKEYAERGKVLIDNGADPKTIAEDFEKDGKVNADIISVAKAHLVDLVKSADNARTQFGEKSTEYQKALKEVQDWSENVSKPMGTKFGEIGRALQGETDLDTGSFVSMKRAVEENTGEPLNKVQEKKVIELTDKVKELNDKNKKLEKKLSDALDKMTVEDNKPENIKEKAKRIADKIRKGKLSRPDIFSSASPASLVWDGALEVSAKTIEGLGTVAQAISDGIQHIKNSDWYKGLDKDKQKEAEKGFTDFFNDKVSNEDLFTRFVNKKNNKFSPQDAKDIWEYAKKEYIDKDKSYGDMLRGVSADLGLNSHQVREALSQPKQIREITDEMYRLQAKRQLAINTAKQWVKAANQPKVVKFLRALPNAFFRLKVFGHGTVGAITHAGMNIFQPSKWKQYFSFFIKQFKYAFGSTAEYQKAMEDLKNDPDFTFWKRAGLAVDPKEVYDDYQALKPFFGRLSVAGDRGFNALKVYRLDLAKSFYDKLPNVSKADPNTAKEIAKLVNHSTGTTEVNVPKWVNTSFFAPKLEIARWQSLITDPGKAAITFTNWGKATEAQKAAAKIVARNAGEKIATYVAALAANSAILSLTNSDQNINFKDPTKSDWLKFKGQGKTLDVTGGIESTMRFMASLLHESYLAYTGSKKDLREQPQKKDYETIGTQLRYKMSPFLSTLTDVLTGSDAIGRPLPFSNVRPKKGEEPYTVGGYLLQQQTPIPISEGVREAVTSMKENGMSKTQINDILKGILVGAISGGTGAKVGEEPKGGGTGEGGGASGSFHAPKQQHPPHPKTR